MKNLIKVRVNQVIEFGDVIYATKHRTYTQAYKDKLYEREEYFRSKLITFVNDAIGDEWHITFIPFTKDSYLIDVYAPTYGDALAATHIVNERFQGEYNFEGEYKGTVQTLINKYQIAA